MIAFKTFTKQLDATQDLPKQQNELRNQLLAFVNEVTLPEHVIQINEWVLPENNQFTLTVWYQTLASKSESDIDLLPEAQSADVLTRSLHEKDRRRRLKTMMDEHIIRSDSG